MTRPTAYMICATPRSGSTMLCDLLTGTGRCGRPNSFFRRESFAEWADHFGLSTEGWGEPHAFDRAYLNAVIDYGTDDTGIFGVRVMRESLDGLLSRLDTFHPGHPTGLARLEAAFGPCLFIHLSRRDKVAQAISLLRAEQSGLWHRHADGSERERLSEGGPPRYDKAALAANLAELEADDTAWGAWFKAQGIEPLRLTYEQLTADPRPGVASVLTGLGLPPAIAETARPRTARLADAQSREWAEKFKAEREAG